MGFDPANVQALGVGLAGYVTTLLFIFIFFHAYNERLARTLGWGMLALAVWAWFGFFFHLTNDVELARIFRIFSLAGEAAGQIFLIRFGFIYLQGLRPPRRWENWLYQIGLWLGIGFTTLFLVDLSGTKILIGDVIPSLSQVLAPTPGPLMIWFVSYYFFACFLLLLFMWRRIFTDANRDTRRYGIILSLVMGAGYFMAGTGFLPWYGITDSFLLSLRGLVLPLFAAAAFYSITNYRLFNLQTIAAEVFIFAIWGFMFFRVLLHDSFREAIPDALLFVAVVVLGLLLIRNIIKEVQTRIKLEEVSEELRVLNNSLEEKVQERTAALSRARAHIESVVQNLPIGLIEMTQDMKVVRLNRVAQEIFAVTSERVVGQPVFARAPLSSVFTEKTQPGQFEITLQSPKKRNLEITLSSVTLEGGRGLIAITRDVTYERALDRAKNEFVSIAAHQLRTPLSALRWVFDLLGTTELNESQKEVVHRGTLGIANMSRIVEGLLMSARTTEGLSHYTFERTDIAELLNKSVGVLMPLAENRKVTLKVAIADDLPKINVDGDKLAFAVQNLVDNAIKYTLEGGTVTLSVERDGEGVVISVSDTGIGISTEEREHLFEKFFRSKRATELFTDGTGLGLFIVKSIIEAHHSHIEVTSEKGQGSTFSFRLAGDNSGADSRKR